MTPEELALVLSPERLANLRPKMVIPAQESPETHLSR